MINNITVNKTQNVTVNKNINITHVQNVSVLARSRGVNNVKVTSLASLGSSKPEANRGEEHVIKLAPVTKEQRVEVSKAVKDYHEAAQQRYHMETRVLSEGGAPHKPSDPPKVIKLNLPKAPTPTATPLRNSRSRRQ